MHFDCGGSEKVDIYSLLLEAIIFSLTDWGKIQRKCLLYAWIPLKIQSRTQSLQAFWSAGQRREDSGDIEFYYRRISAVKQRKPLRNSQNNENRYGTANQKNWIFLMFPALPRWPKSLKTLGTRLLKIWNEYFFSEPAVAYLLTKMVPSLSSLNEIQDGCRCCCDCTFSHVFWLILKASIVHESRRNYDSKHYCSFWH